MSSHSRRASTLVAFAAPLTLLACSASGPEPQRCASDAECASNARCLSSTCVANAAPLASVELPAVLEAHLLVTFDGSSSADPDYAAGDSIVSHAWAFRSVGAPCDPPAVAGTGPSAPVRFACPGIYAVDLTVTDEMAASTVASREFEVLAYSGPTLVEISPDLAVQHECTAAPRCSPVGAIVLSATPTPAAPAGLAFSWTAEPPADRPLDANRRVTFDPGPNVASPGILVETDGQAISGDWIFHVEAHDDAGVVASGAVRVSVLNRPPVVAATVPVPDHLFDGSQFSAGGEIPFTVTDPDGDAVVRSTEWRHTGDGGGSFAGVVDEVLGQVTFSVQVPYATPSDAAHLIGGAGLERTIVFTVQDVNGAVTVENWPIVVGNRPPTVQHVPAFAVVDHGYDPVALAYTATPPLTAWTDPDGDPLARVPGSDTGDPGCPTFDVAPGGLAVGRCSHPFAGAPTALTEFLGTHTVTQRVQDPWVEASTSSTVQFAVGNRAPAIKSTAELAYNEACQNLACCHYVAGEGCLTFEGTSPAGTKTVTSRWTDPDGDPLDVQVTGGASVTAAQPLVCTPASCSLRLDFGALPGVCGDVVETLSMTVTDGSGVASGSLPVRRSCY